jgi:hypothetical protein
MKFLGRRYRLPNNLIAEVFDSGATILRRDGDKEFYDAEGKLNSTTDDYAQFWVEIGRPENVKDYIQRHGRPCGMIWEEPTMRGNQYTTTQPMTGRNLNIRLSEEQRARVNKAAKRQGATAADVVREALEHYLPILESLPAKENTDG